MLTAKGSKKRGEKKKITSSCKKKKAWLQQFPESGKRWGRSFARWKMIPTYLLHDQRRASPTWDNGGKRWGKLCVCRKGEEHDMTCFRKGTTGRSGGA